MALANARLRDASFQALFNNRMKPISQLKLFAYAVAVSVVDALDKSRAGVFDEDLLHQDRSGPPRCSEVSWARRCVYETAIFLMGIYLCLD
ncbi:hypothetical protein ACV356_31545, partial [Pseudomonas aeruginosa]